MQKQDKQNYKHLSYDLNCGDTFSETYLLKKT
jgi:hypothetical protein